MSPKIRPKQPTWGRQHPRKVERENQMLAMAKSGITFADIAKKYGVSRERARQILLRLGYEAKDFQEARRNRRAERFLPDYYDGFTPTQIADRHGTTYETVRRALREAGYKPRAFQIRPKAWDLTRMLDHTEKKGDCMIWKGSIFPTGYPRSPHEALKDVDRYAHREVYKLVHGELPEGMWICHTCDVKACVNPEHLEAMSPRERVHMSLKRDRFDQWMRTGKRLDGEPAKPGYNNKLTVDQVGYIKRCLLDRICTQKALADRFDVAEATISAINRGRTWPDVEPARSR